MRKNKLSLINKIALILHNLCTNVEIRLSANGNENRYHESWWNDSRIYPYQIQIYQKVHNQIEHFFFTYSMFQS